MKLSDSTNNLLIKGVVVVFFIIVLTLILLAASNYPVQWRDQVNKERFRNLEVFAQALEYFKLDHDGELFPIPTDPALISNQSGCIFSCPSLGDDISCFDLQRELVPNYMSKILQDPLLTSDADSGYFIAYTEGVLTLGACHKFFKDPILLQRKL